MGHYDYEVNYYEPHELEIICSEYTQKCKEIMLAGITAEFNNLKAENENLKKANNDYCKRENEIAAKERELERKFKILKSEVEAEFYKATIEDVLERYAESSQVWHAKSIKYQRTKCQLCDKERKIAAKFPNGEIIKKPCSCDTVDHIYEPELLTIKYYNFLKESELYTTRGFYISGGYQPAINGCIYNLKLQMIFDDFNDEIVELEKSKKINNSFVFRTKESCQKYCDWLNSINVETK